MKKHIIVLLTLLLASTSLASAQAFGPLAAKRNISTASVDLSWSAGPAGTSTITRWTALNPTPVAIGTSAGTTFTDTTAVPNTVYLYRVANGPTQSNSVIGVVSDLTQPFTCPFVQPVDSSLFGQDRNVSFQSANGAQTTVTVRAPVTTSTVTVPPCNGAGGCDDRTNINAAFGNGVKVQLQAGHYFTNPPNAGNPGNINFNVHNDSTLAGTVDVFGEPTTFLHFNVPPNLVAPFGIAIPAQSRTMVRDLAIMWQQINAIPGVVNTVGGVQRFNITSNPTYYVPNPASPPIAFSSNGYNTTTRTFSYQTGARVGTFGTFNANFGVDGLYYYSMPGILYPDGTQAILWVNKTQGTISIADSADTTIANVRVYGGGGPGITTVGIHPNYAGGLWVVNSKIVRKPDSLLGVGEQPWLVSLFGDNDANATNGNIIWENNEIGFMGDDALALAGGFLKPTASIISTSHVTFTQSSQLIFHTQNSNDLFQFRDETTLASLGSPQLGTWTQTCSGPCPGIGTVWTLDVTLATPILGLAPYVGSGPVWGAMPLYANQNFVFRNNCFHDMIGRVLVTAGSNGLVQGNTAANIYFGPFVNSFAPISAANPGYGNIIWDGNLIVGAGYGQLDTDWLSASTLGAQTGYPTAAITVAAIAGPGFVPAEPFDGAFGGYPNVAFEIVNNTIWNVPGLCILVNSSDKVGITNNTCADANSVPYTAGYNATFCGANSHGFPLVATPVCFNFVAAQQAIMASHVTNLDTTSAPNNCRGSTVGCVFLDVPTIENDLIFGIIH